MDSPAEDMIQKKFHAADDGWLGRAEKAQPFGRLLKTTEVAEFVAILLSERSGLMTGSIIDFDQSVNGTHE
jgi:NAD(P)-dependent dehydrogenase (short-subunit alcohol dehydrogenase family)